MIQFNPAYVENELYISEIITKAKRVLTKRKLDYARFCKQSGLPIERYIATTGTSYFAGKTPEITVKRETDDRKKNVVQKIFGKILGTEDTQMEYQLLLDYINDYNDMPAFFYNLAKDYFSTGACYWITYETMNNELVFAEQSSRQCIALYDYSTPVKLIGGLRIYEDTDKNGDKREIAVLTLPNEKRYYINDERTKKDEFKEDIDMREETRWDLTPFYAVENPDNLSLFDGVEDLICKLEQVLENQSNTFQYNDEAKLKVTGYMPQEPLMTTTEKGDKIPNPARTIEDEVLLNAKVFYTPDQTGSIDWITKNINDTAVMNYTKTLTDFIFMLAMIPNMNDISFSNADSGKAIEQKFFGLEQVLIEAEKLFKKELLRMYENLTYRINAKKNTKYDFREIEIKLTRNLPVSKEDITNMWLQLYNAGLLSEETVIDNLPLELDARTEFAKKEEEQAGNILNTMQKVTEEEPKEE